MNPETPKAMNDLPDISGEDSAELKRLCEQSAREVKLAGSVSAATSLEMIGHARELEIKQRGLISEVERQAGEIERLRSGNFSVDEFQGLCHNRSVQDGFEAFADGCETYQRQLFGRCRKGVAE